MNRTDARKQPRPAARGTNRAEEDSPALLFRHLLRSLFITVAIGAFLTLVASLGAYFYEDPDVLTQPLGIVAVGLTALAGGFTATRLHGHSALLCGLLNGLSMTALIILASLFFTEDASGYSAGVSCLLHAGVPFLSVCGAYLGLMRKKTPGKTKHGKR